jgi:copper-binding protein NosD
LFSFARYLFSCAFFLSLMLFDSPARAEWSWSYPFYSTDSSGVSAKPAATEASGQPVKDSGVSTTAVPPPASSPDPEAKPAETVLPSPPRTLSVFAPTLKPGGAILDEDTQWSGSLLIEGMVTVSPQTTLTIMPGTVIRFAAGSGILVLGRIAVQGTPENPVVITSMFDKPLPSDWSGIFLTGTEKSNVFDHVVIQGADTAIQASFSAFAANGLRIDTAATAMRLSNSTVSVRNSAVSSAMAGILAVKSEVDLEAMTFEQNRTALSLQSSALTAVNVRLRSSTGTALTAEKSQLKLDRMLFSFNLNGLRTLECDGSVINSRFISNSGTAAILTASHLKFTDNHVSGSSVGVQVDDNSPTLWRNSISGNSSYNLLYLGAERYFAGGNWLGQKLSENTEISVFSKQPGALLTAPLLAVDPHPPVRVDSTKATD